jgi:histidyl-tRNA synthetase
MRMSSTDPTEPGQKFRPKARRPRGLEDRRGPALARTRDIIGKVSKVYEAWGFEPLETSALEYADALGKFLPDQDRPNEGVFAFPDDDEQWLSLRYDLTAPLARYVAENFDALPKPFRRWAAGPVWRNEKPGPGRFREFWQCDADTVGSASPAADAEMIAMACAALEAAGIERGRYVLKVNTRRLLNAVLDDASNDPKVRLTVLRAIDKLDRLGVQGVSQLLGAGRKDESGDFTPGAGLSAKQIDNVIAFVKAGRGGRGETLAELERVILKSPEADAGLLELRGIDDALAGLGVAQTCVSFEPSVVRGLEYYTGPVFEAELLATDANGRPISFGSVGGGGRYDDLVARFRGERIPATGFSIGVSRLVAALEASQASRADEQKLVVILALEADQMGEYFRMASELRAAGVRAEVYLGGSGMRAQMKYADKRGAALSVIVGGDERAKGVVTIKDLALGAEMSKTIADNEEWRKGRPAQVEASRGDLVDVVKKMLA